MSKIKYHPLYEEYCVYWKKLIDAYEGTGGFRDGSYLFRHDRESDWKYVTRCRMAKYFNFAEIIVDTFRDSCLRERPIRAAEDKTLEEIFNDIDHQGKDWDSFIKDQLTLALVYGFVDTLVEMPSFNESEIINSLDAREEKIRPYLVPVQPLDVVNWEYDRNGLKSIMIKETSSQPSFFDDPTITDEQSTRYRLFNRQSWALYNTEGEEISSGEHNLGFVPLVRLYCKRSLIHRHLGRSILPDPAVFIDYFNLDSEKREIFRQQTFSLLLISLGENSSMDDIKNLVLTGTNNALALPYGATAEFISPDPEQARLIIEEQKQLVRNIFRLKHLKYDTDSASEKSGEAYKWDYKDMHEVLAGLAKNLEAYEYQVVKMISGWTSDPSLLSKFSVSYPCDFNVYSLSETLETASKLFELRLGKELETAFSKRLLLPKLMSLTEEEKKNIYAGIENRS